MCDTNSLNQYKAPTDPPTEIIKRVYNIELLRQSLESGPMLNVGQPNGSS